MPLQFQTHIDSTNPMHIYYDINMINNDQINGQPAPQVIYNDSRNVPFINCPSDYYFSIIRFSLMTPGLPVFIPQVQIGQGDLNRTIYQFIISYGGNTLFTHIEYNPQNQLAPQPAAPLTVQDLTSDYYFVTSYQYWADTMNTALANLCASFSPALDAPFFIFDVNTSLFNLYFPNSVWGSSAQLYVNNSLASILDSFTMSQQDINYNSMTNVQVYNISCINRQTNLVTVGSNPYILMSQESTTIPIMNPVSSIVFTSGLLPISASLVNPALVFGANSQIFNASGNNAAIANIATDFQVNLSNANTYRESVEYVPAGEYRLLDMYGNSPLSSLQIAVLWKDQYGNLHNFRLNSGCTCTIKILFRRRDFYSYSLEM